MENYNTLLDAINGLKAKGYIHDFSMKPDCIECPALRLHIHPENFEVTEVYRFEGMSNPDDNAVVYAIESADGLKGILIDAYGAYAESVTPEMAEKMKTHRLKS